ncbi:hypothetical protein GWI33_008916 [Rhynchophorus ferrugineus]|uniref:MICOS complex subunit MIC13 n=1 Tax=Rhynchophorus ferrugineus TaxID=354439 RepID=A0A834MNM9_RHYFE|nr:hypothetical protein GWI33_008916 [Rhynchophorus ferrugineus]
MTSPKNKENCIKKSNVLVYKQPTGQRVTRPEECAPKLKIPICKPKPKRIKICTGSELRKMCPPQVCPKDLPKKKPNGFMKFLGFGAKSILAASLVYVTYDMGIWGNGDDTQDLYYSACTAFKAPQPRKNDKWDPPSCEAESDLFTHPRYDPYARCNVPPLSAETSYLLFQRYWNIAVQNVFSGIANFPSNIIERVTNATKAKEKEENVCVPVNQLDAEDQKKILSRYK